MNTPEVQQALRTHLMFCRIKPEDIKFCDVKPLREDLKKGLRGVEFKACFNNAFRYATNYNGIYCLGYAASIIPVEHAWVRVNDDYFDPTWEKYSKIGSGYASVIELDGQQLMEVVEQNDWTPPSIWDLVRLEIISPSTVDPFEEIAKINMSLIERGK